MKVCGNVMIWRNWRRHLMLTKEISEVEKEIKNKRRLYQKAVLLKRQKRVGLFQDLRVLTKELSTLKSAQAKFDKLKETFNPDKAFPLDIFPDISKEELEDLDILLRTKKSFPLDRLSAFIGRKHYKNFIDELSSKQEGKEHE